MRISSMQVFRQGVDAMLAQQTRLATTQNQLATGKRIVNPSDDPTGAASLIGLSESSRVTEQYQRNIDRAVSRLELEDSVLGSVVEGIQRARELTVQGLNTTNNAGDRNAIAKEIRQILDEVKGLANRKDGTGNYLFGGYQVKTVPVIETTPGNFVYNGDGGQRQVQAGPARQIADGDPGRSVFMDIPAAAGVGDVFTTLYSLASDLEANAPDGASLDQLDNALDNFLNIRASAGARLNALDSQKSINAAFLEQLEITRSGIEDLDYAEAATRLSQESVALQAAQQAFVKVQNMTLFNYI